MTSNNGASLNGHSKNNLDVSSILEDWLFLVREDPGALASAGKYGFNVDTWDKPNVIANLRGKKVIMVFSHFGEEHKDEFEALGAVREASPMLLRVWKPFGLGDEITPDLRSLSQRYCLSELLFWDKPWENPPPPITELRKAGWPCTDLGNAERMASRYGPVLRFCWPWKKWLTWDGQKWAQDEAGRVNVLAKSTVRKICEEAAAARDEDERKMYLGWGVKCEAAGRISNMLQLVRSEPRIPLLPAVLDPSPWLFNCPNGTIDLKTGRLNNHNRSDLITRMSPVEFDPGAECPLWEATVRRIFADDEDLIGFVQRLFGMCLTGDVSSQVLPIFYGEGGNGKSTILNALIDIMGPDYAIAAPPGLLFAKHSEGHPTDKASLFGMRLVVDLESAEGARLNEALVKQLTGSDRISARRMREDFWTFLPTHKLIIGTNSQPAIQETKNAIWRRLKLVPFTVEIPEAEQQKDLAARLREEFPGILSWCVRGCVEWVTNGLNTPESVQKATAEYRAEEDSLGTFIADECLLGDSYRIKASTLYKRYVDQLDHSGPNRISRQSFGRAMTKKGFKKSLSNGKWYLGIDLRSDTQEADDGSY
jgi:putative DNA primase/helicase